MMESLKKQMCAKTLLQLQLFEDKVLSDTHHQSRISETQKEINELSNTVLKLSKLKSELLQRLKHTPAATKSIIDISFSSTIHNELIHKAAKWERKCLLNYLVSAYRCIGITTEIVGPGKIRIRYETFYNGEFFEPYYLELEFNDQQVKMCWHTIPVFVPLKSLVEQYNNHEIPFLKMVDIVSVYLTSCVKRRQQAIEFSTKYANYLREDIAASLAYNSVQLILQIPVNEIDMFQIVIQLYYRDLQSVLPSNVRCTDTAFLSVHRSRIKKAFITLPIAEAFQNLFLDQNIEQG